jgi:SsrA-binding protein
MVSRNKKLHLEYNIEYEVEAGICLKGDEVKSIRKTSPSINESYGTVVNGEIFIRNLQISQARDPYRLKKLLLHKKQIRRISIMERNVVLVFKEMYELKGRFKIILCCATRLKLVDKRIQIREKEMQRYSKDDSY